jgi:hypothetical protein
MATELRERLFPFDGEDPEYISYLETKLMEVRSMSPVQNLADVPPLGLNSSISDSDSGLPPREDWMFVYCRPSKQNGLATLRRSRVSSSNPIAASTTFTGRVRKQEKTVLRIPQWRNEMNRFTASIPTLCNWATKRSLCGFDTQENHQKALQLMLGAQPNNIFGSDVLWPLPADSSDAVMRACNYGRMANYSISSGRLAILVGKYQKLIFIGYCVVLLSLGTSKDTVNWMMRQYISDSNDKNLERYRLGCLWVNRTVSRLLKLGWGYKSWEIFVLCK